MTTLGPCTLEAAEAICGPQAADQDSVLPGAAGQSSVLEGLAALVDKSLLRQTGTADEGRVEMLEMIQEYARAHLEESADAPALHWRHATYYLALAREGAAGLGGAEQVVWLDWLERDVPNLRAAEAWLAEHGAVEEALHLEGTLGLFWSMRGDWEEQRVRLAGLLARPDAAARTAGRAAALSAAGFLAWAQGRYREAQALRDEELGINQEIGHQGGIADALFGLGQAAAGQGDQSLARARFEESLALSRPLGELYLTAWSLLNLSGLSSAQDNWDETRALLDEAIGIQRALGDRWGLACSLLGRARLGRREGNLQVARAQAAEALALVQELGIRDTVASALTILGNVALDEGDHAAARACYAESLTIWREMGDEVRLALILYYFAGLTAVQQQPARALRLAGAAAALHDVPGFWEPFEQAEWESQLALARQALGTDEAAAACAEGEAMMLEQATAYALEGLSDG